MRKVAFDRLMERVRKTDTCWLWEGPVDNKGYGCMFYKGRGQRTHRIMWQEVFGEIPSGKVICHRCDNPPCCNPEHLFMGTQADNLQDCSAKGRLGKHIGVRGEANVEARLTQKLADSIRAEYALGGVSMATLAKRHSVGETTIRDVLHGRNWNTGTVPALAPSRHRNKLTAASARAIHAVYWDFPLSRQTVGDAFGVSATTVKNIAKGLTWRAAFVCSCGGGR